MIEVLAEQRADSIYEGLRTAPDHFASDRDGKDERTTILAELKRPFSGHAVSGTDWYRRLKRQVRTMSKERKKRAENIDVPSWGAEMVRAICSASSEVAADTSLEVARNAILLAREKAEQQAEVLRQKAAQDRDPAKKYQQKGLNDLTGRKGKLRLDDAPVTDAFKTVASGLTFEWRSVRRERTAEVLEAAAREVLPTAARALGAAASQANGALKEDEVTTWPTIGSGIPKDYLPATVEFPLEDHNAWPDQLKQLCKEAVRRDASATRPVDAVRRVLVGGDRDGTLPPLLNPSDPQASWAPGVSLRLSCDARSGAIKKRVDEWTGSPGSPFSDFFREGLRAYLSENNPDTDEQQVDHVDRIKSFRHSLEQALVRSQPLVQINPGLHRVVHQSDVAVDRLCAAFPFQEGHPAAEVAREVVGKDNYRVTDTDTSSVLVSHYMSSPVHPMVVKSFTEPVSRSVASFGADEGRFRSSFWLFRRARTLPGFTPMAPDMLKAMIRGFAVGRLCGYLNLGPSRPRISSPEGPVTFPGPMLSSVEQDDMLAALIENFSLCYALVDAQKLLCFKAYELLYELGEHRNPVHDDLRRLLATGNTLRHTVDEPKCRGTDPEAREKTAVLYLDLNIKRFDRLASADTFTGEEYRHETGHANPNVPSMEIAAIAAECHQEVRQAVEEVSAGGVA